MNEKVLFNEIEQDCKTCIDRIINNFLKDKKFNTKDLDFMMNKLQDSIITDLKKISNNFKFIINILLLENDKSGFVQDINLYYDNITDGHIIEKYSFKGISCIVNLLCLAL